MSDNLFEEKPAKQTTNVSIKDKSLLISYFFMHLN